jgi:IPT/TIG domain-containing protein
MTKLGKTRSIGLCVGVAFVLSVATAPSASAAEGPILVLKANGQTLTNGALVNVSMGTKPEFSFKSLVTVEGTTTPVEQEFECENYLEQGKIQRDMATNTWRVVEPHPVEVCEGAPWLELAMVENRLTISPPNIATDELSIELFRSEEAVRAEERKQAEAGQEVDPREPLRCAYTTTSSKGTFGRSTKKPLVAKIKGKMALHPLATGAGCGLKKAKWKGSFAMTYKGQPVFVAFEMPPTVSGLSPEEGPEAEGTSVQITGTGFTGATAVTFGTTSAASFKVNSDSSITAVAPKGSGTVDVTVTTPVSTSTTSAADHFTFQPPPTVTEISPKTGPESGGTEVAISGTNFTSGSTVKFGTTSASSVKFNSSSSITAFAPKASGTVDVTVTTAGGMSMTSSADQFTYIPGV